MSAGKFDNTCLLDLTEAVILSGKPVKVKTSGYSMRPFINKGSVATVERHDFHKIKVGDVVVFKDNSNFIAHRVIRIKKRADNWLLICKGDSRSRADSPFGVDKYIGKVTAIETKHKIVDYETKKQKCVNRFLAFISPYTPLFYFTLRFVKKQIKSKSNNKQHL